MQDRPPDQAPWRRFLVDGGPPTELASKLDAGQPLLVVARWSQADGSLPERRAAEDLRGATEVVKKQVGIDLLNVLPSRERIEQLIASAQRHIEHSIDGKDVRHRFVTIDRIAEAGAVFFVAAGSGSKTNDTGIQPFAEEARRHVLAYKPALFACKRFDRFTRNKWAAGSVIMAMENYDTWLCDDETLGPLDGMLHLMAFIKGYAASQEAENMLPKSRRGQAYNTGREMVGGQVSYHVGGFSPPGTAVVTMRGPGPNSRERLLYLDTEACRPDPASVASGMPEVFDANGNPVDEVENVRFLLARHGLPSWSTRRLARELAARGFSTPGLRSHRKDLSATIDSTQLIYTVLAHLANYENETIAVNLDEHSFTISGFAPPDGKGWATAADFARIKRVMSERSNKHAGRTLLPLAGLPVTVNGIDAKMLTEWARYRGDPTSRYRFVQADIYPEEARTFTRGALLPHTIIAQSIIDGLLRVSDSPLQPASALKPSRPTSGLDKEAAELEQLLAQSRDDMERLACRIKSDDEAGTGLSGALLKRISDDYNRLADVDIPSQEEQLARVRGQIEAELARPQRGAPTSELLLLVDDLRNSNSELRGVWREALQDLAITLERTEPNSGPGVLIGWRGTVLLSDDAGNAVRVPFSGSYDTKSTHTTSAQQIHLKRLAADTDAVIEHLRAGQLWPSETGARVVREVTARLGYPQGTSMWLVDCDDSRISRIATECRLAPDEAATSISNRLDEPEALVNRVRRVHNQPLGPWLPDGQEVEVALHAIAAGSDGLVTADQVCAAVGTSRGTVYTAMHELRRRSDVWVTLRKRGYQLAPCSCGSHRRAPTRLREVDGPICLGCRTDLSGVEWPSDPYDTYLAHPHLWQLAETEHPD